MNHQFIYLAFIGHFLSGLKPGRLFDCQFYHADAWVCMSQEQSVRKYDWIEYENGKILGKKNQCESKILFSLVPVKHGITYYLNNFG